MVKNIGSSDEFNEVVNGSEVCVVDFYAVWCGPCKAVAPKIEETERELNKEGSETKDRAKFFKVDVDELMDLAQEQGISAMPTFLIFRKGVLIKTIVGANYFDVNATVKKALDTKDEDTTDEKVDAEAPKELAETSG